jgi:CheY-like chemotaxis protein
MSQINVTKDSKKQKLKKSSRTGNAFLKRLHFKHAVKILFIEDNIFNQELATYVLDKLGCIAEIADSGAEGIELLRTKSYDLILMDINMPGLNGFETTRIIREELLIEIPIIAFTTNTGEEDIRKCLKEGMNDHIGKPYTEHELSWIISKWTSKQK